VGLDRDLIAQLRHLLRPLANRVANSIARAVVQLADDDKKLQLVQLGVLAGETIDDGERFAEYGFTSVPLPGAEAVVVFPNGDRAHPLVIAVDDRRYRPTGEAPGTVIMYGHAGQRIRCLPDGDIEVIPGGSGEVRIGTTSAADPIARKSDIDAIETAITNAAVIAGDGGAALKANILASWPGPVGSAKARVD
jgi:phage baseplate assembly protein V